MARRDERYEARKAYIREWQKRRYAKYKGKLCVYCWKPWTNPKRTYCDACYERVREKKAQRSRDDREKWREKGLCLRCSHPLNPETDTGRQVCFACIAESGLHKGQNT